MKFLVLNILSPCSRRIHIYKYIRVCMRVYIYTVYVEKKNVETCVNVHLSLQWRAVWDEGGCFRCLFLNTLPLRDTSEALFKGVFTCSPHCLSLLANTSLSS